MNVDVSEIKTFKQCKRQWQLTSRNQYHLQPAVAAKALAFGTIFHEALAQLYLGADFDKVLSLVRSEMDPKNDVALIAMLKGYYDQVLIEDQKRFQVLEVEHKFKFPSPVDGVDCVGAIDLIVLDPSTNTVYGVEHKTTSNFRQAAFLWIDEQPRVYFEALDRYVEEFAANQREPAEPYTNGGIYLNEVKKLLRGFQYRRTLCFYEDEDRENFWSKYTQDLLRVQESTNFGGKCLPDPSYFGCQMCAFQGLCADFGYKNIQLGAILEDYGNEFQVREEDHLSTKLSFGGKL